MVTMAQEMNDRIKALSLGACVVLLRGVPILGGAPHNLDWSKCHYPRTRSENYKEIAPSMDLNPKHRLNYIVFRVYCPTTIASLESP